MIIVVNLIDKIEINKIMFPSAWRKSSADQPAPAKTAPAKKPVAKKKRAFSKSLRKYLHNHIQSAHYIYSKEPDNLHLETAKTEVNCPAWSKRKSAQTSHENEGLVEPFRTLQQQRYQSIQTSDYHEPHSSQDMGDSAIEVQLPAPG